MPVARLDAVELAPREVRATAILGATYLDTLHAAGCADLANCDEVPVQPTYMHHQKIYPAELRAIAEVGADPNTGLRAPVPVPGGRDDDPVHDARRPAVRSRRSRRAPPRRDAGGHRRSVAARALGRAAGRLPAGAARRRVAAARADPAEPVPAGRRGNSPRAHPVRHGHVRSGGRLPAGAADRIGPARGVRPGTGVAATRTRTASARRPGSSAACRARTTCSAR